MINMTFTVVKIAWPVTEQSPIINFVNNLQ